MRRPRYNGGCSNFGIRRRRRGSDRTLDARIFGNFDIFAPDRVANGFGALSRILVDQYFFLDPRGFGNDCLFGGFRHFDHLFGEVVAGDRPAIGYGATFHRDGFVAKDTCSSTGVSMT